MPEKSLELLARADAAPALPRLGGMARPNGVVIVSAQYWAFAGTDGTLREGEMPKPPAAMVSFTTYSGVAMLSERYRPSRPPRSMSAAMPSRSCP